MQHKVSCHTFEGDSVAAKLFHDQVTRSQGIFSYPQIIRCWGTLPLSAWTWMTEKIGLFQQPRLLRIEHRL